MEDSMNSDIFDHGNQGFHNHIDHQGHNLGYSMHNGFGGKNYFNSDGSLAGHTADNHMGGKDYFDSHGSHLGHTVHADHGMPDFIHADGHIGSTPHIFNSHDPFSHTAIHNHFHTMRSDLLGKIY
jgi:hypothetical protein